MAVAVLEVANGGPVVPPDEVERLFDRFYRPDKSRSRKTGGFGLGLSIVRSVVTAHGGTVELTAPETGGLCVTVSHPRPPSRSARRRLLTGVSRERRPYATDSTMVRMPSAAV